MVAGTPHVVDVASDNGNIKIARKVLKKEIAVPGVQ